MIVDGAGYEADPGGTLKFAQKALETNYFDRDVRLIFAEVNLAEAKRRVTAKDRDYYISRAAGVLKENKNIFSCGCISANILGRIYLEKKEYLKALREFSYSISKEPYYFESMFLSAKCFAGMGMYRKALGILDKIKIKKHEITGFTPRSNYDLIITRYNNEAVEKLKSSITSSKIGAERRF